MWARRYRNSVYVEHFNTIYESQMKSFSPDNGKWEVTQTWLGEIITSHQIRRTMYNQVLFWSRCAFVQYCCRPPEGKNEYLASLLDRSHDINLYMHWVAGEKQNQGMCQCVKPCELPENGAWWEVLVSTFCDLWVSQTLRFRRSIYIFVFLPQNGVQRGKDGEGRLKATVSSWCLGVVGERMGGKWGESQTKEVMWGGDV